MELWKEGFSAMGGRAAAFTCAGVAAAVLGGDGFGAGGGTEDDDEGCGSDGFCGLGGFGLG